MSVDKSRRRQRKGLGIFQLLSAVAGANSTNVKGEVTITFMAHSRLLSRQLIR
uniref:Uncharacterized protein n=1 Tax=Arion vulgaris TaxID=1028688 RepID=A0A0B7BGR1_9EUPU